MTWDREGAKSGVLTVGDGRGFVIAPPAPRFSGRQGPFIITAAHCLPHLPPAASIAHWHERTYAKLVGGLHSKPSVWVECLFVDPVADVAVLGSPEVYEEARVYEELVEGVTPFLVTDLPAPTRSVRELRGIIQVYDPETGEHAFQSSEGGRIETPDPVTLPAWLLSLDSRWIRCRVTHNGGPLWISGAEDKIRGGMSGSPILNDGGVAIGVVATSPDAPTPWLMGDLPGWLLRQLGPIPG